MDKILNESNLIKVKELKKDKKAIDDPNQLNKYLNSTLSH